MRTFYLILFFCLLFIKGHPLMAQTTEPSDPDRVYLVSAIGDIDGFRHDNLDKSPPSGRIIPRYGTNTSIDYAEKKPSFMVRTHNNSDGHYGAFSTNGGTTWAAFGSATAGF